jgi:hypothetical protein
LANAKRVSISLDEEQIKLLEFVKGFGTKEAEKVKNILMSYLSEKGYLVEFNKKKNSGSRGGEQK